MTAQAVSRLHDVTPRVLNDDNSISDVDVATEMDAAMGDLSGFELFGDQLLVGVYVRGNVLPSGLIVLDMAKEDIWQGKVTRILKLGSGIGEKERARFGDRPLAVGDWIFNRVEDTFQMSYKGPGSVASKLLARVDDDLKLGGAWPCRLIYLRDIYGRLAHPNLIV